MKPRIVQRGASLVEALIIVAVLGALAAVSMPSAGKAIRRGRAISAISSLNRVLTRARLSSVRRGTQVVAQLSRQGAGGYEMADRIRVVVWEDRNPDFVQGTFDPPGGGAPQPETVLDDYLCEGTFHVWKRGQALDDYLSGVAFNTYGGDTSLTARIAFLPSGGIVLPQGAGCGAPTAAGGRGVYVADRAGRNFFRLTIPSAVVARVRVEKWSDASSSYTAANWTWQ